MALHGPAVIIRTPTSKEYDPLMWANLPNRIGYPHQLDPTSLIIGRVNFPIKISTPTHLHTHTHTHTHTASHCQCSVQSLAARSWFGWSSSHSDKQSLTWTEIGWTWVWRRVKSPLAYWGESGNGEKQLWQECNSEYAERKRYTVLTKRKCLRLNRTLRSSRLTLVGWQCRSNSQDQVRWVSTCVDMSCSYWN